MAQHWRALDEQDFEPRIRRLEEIVAGLDEGNTDSPVFTGDPTAPTPPPGDDDNSIATTAFVQQEIANDLSGFLNSPVFTGNPRAPTPPHGDNDTSIATTAFVQAAFVSPVLSGNPTATTPPPGDNDLSIATTAFVHNALTNPVFSGDPQAPMPPPGDNDLSIATTAFVQQEIGVQLAAGLVSPIFTGDPTAPTAPPGDNDLSIATTAFVQREIASDIAALLVSPVFTGDPRAPTPAPGDNDTSIATTAFVQGELVLKLDDSQLSTDGTLAANSDSLMVSQKAIRTYVSTAAAGMHYTDAVRVATTGNGTLATAFAAGQVVDGITLVLADRILLKNQTTGSQNGIYVVTAGTPTRALDADVGAEMKGIACLVTAGTVNAGSQWQCTNATVPVLGTDAITFGQIASGASSYTAGTGLSLTGNTFAVSDPELLALLGLASAADRLPYFTGSGTAALAPYTAFARTMDAAVDNAAARTLLGLGTAAVQNIGTAGATVPLLSTANTWALAQTVDGNITTTGGHVMVDRTGDASAATLYIQNDAGFIGGTVLRTGALTRWYYGKNASAEAGASAGSDFFFNAYDDAGASLGSVFLITRSTRIVAFGVSPTAPTPTAGDSSTKLATTAFVGGAISTAGATFQPLDATLTAFGGLTGANNVVNRLPFFSGTDAFTTVLFTPFSQGLLAISSDTLWRAGLGLGSAAVQNIGTSGANVPLMSTANIWSATQSIAATNPTFLVNKNASGGLAAFTYQTAGANRWSMASNAVAESGSDAGSDFDLKRYSDAGASLGTALTIKRSTGVVDFEKVPTIASVPILSAGSTGFIFASQEGMIEDDGLTDMSPLFVAACNKAITQKKTLILDLYRIRFKTVFRLDSLAAGSNLRIHSFIGTKLVLSPGTAATTANAFGVISGTEVQGVTPVIFNTTAGYVKVTEYPYTTLVGDTDVGWTCQLANVAGIQPGYFIKIKSKHLPISEHRYSDCRGELNRVRTVNPAGTPAGTIELDTKLRHKYRIGVLHTTTITAVSQTVGADGYGKTSITIAASPPADIADKMFGLLFKTTGTERFLQWWDPATKTLSFPFNGAWDQYPYMTTTEGQVRVATTANGTFTTAFANGQTVDGVVLATGNRILLKNQTAASQNGIYTVNASGSPTRAVASDTGAELMTTLGGTVYVTAGTANAGTQWQCSNSVTPVVGTDPITFTSITPTGNMPAIGSTITFSADPYVFVYAPIRLSISGVEIDATEDTGNTQRGIQINYVDQLEIRDFQATNFQAWGLNISGCFEPALRFSRNDRSNYENLGYTTLYSECRNGVMDGFRSHNNRRMTDCGGAVQCIGMHITNFEVNGGWKQNLGQEWEDETLSPPEYNYGIGDHGQALDWVWENGIVRNVKIGCIFRGGAETVRNVKFEGRFYSIFTWGAGYGRTVENIVVDDVYAADGALEDEGDAFFSDYEVPNFIYASVFEQTGSGYRYEGSATVRNITINNALRTLIYFGTAEETNVEVPDWIVENISWRTLHSAGNGALFLSGLSGQPTDTQAAWLKNFTAQNINVYFWDAAGSLFGEMGRCAIAPNSWMKIGQGKFRFRLNDDAILTVPHAPTKSAVIGNLHHVVAYPTAPAVSNWGGNFLADGSSITAEITPVTNMTVVSRAAIGVSDPDGSLNVSPGVVGTDSQAKIRNRLGGEIWGILELTQ